MLGGDLTGSTFLDLCAGSGQIGLEAASRGAITLVNEPDERRHAQIARLVSEWHVEGIELRRDKGQILVPWLVTAARSFDVTYVDPPYEATRHGRPLSTELLEQLAASTVPATAGLVIVQHQNELELPAAPGQLALIERRPYGATDLSIYSRQS